MIKLQPKQAIAFNTDATETLYGGAAGGGKSYLLRTSAIRWCMEVAGIQVYLFRRTLTDLRDNHLRGPTSFHVMLAELVKAGSCKYRAVENEFEFWNGSVLHLCYCDSENDVEKYRGAEMHVFMPDELTHFSDYQYRFLRGRVRLAGLKVPEQYRGRLPRIEAGSNPGSIGHAWVKRAFISPRPELEVWQTPDEEGGMKRQFIPARLSDNKELTNDDPLYAARLKGLGREDLVRAMLDGDWNIVAGQAFEKLGSKNKIEPLEPPADWLVFGSLDWGSSRPWSFGLWAVSNGDSLADGRVYPRGALVRFRERYGWNGKPNEGARMEVEEVADEILKCCGYETGWGAGSYKPAYIAADPSMWKVDGGPSHAEKMNRRGAVLRQADNSRVAGYLEVRARIAGDIDGPMLYATKNCHDGFWRTMPDIVMDRTKTEDIDTDQEDHCFVLGTKTFGGEVGVSGTVLSLGGWANGFGTAIHTAKVVRLTFDDGDIVVCTPDHRFMAENGAWVKAGDLIDEVCYNELSSRRAQWLQSFIKSVRNFLVSGTTFADSIFNGRGHVCIEMCGNTSMEQSQKECTFTTRMKTNQTTRLTISKWFRKAITSHIIQKKQITEHRPKQRMMPQNYGMHQKMEENGIQSMQKEYSQELLWIGYRKFVRFVVRRLMQSGFMQTAQFIAVLTAAKQRCVSVDQAGEAQVTCLHVNGINAFALEGGTIVHNCVDDVRYACMSRPWMQKKVVPKAVKRDWFDFGKQEVESWRTV